MMPVTNVCNMERIGGEADGGKLTCGLTHIPHGSANEGPACAVYPLGSHGNYKFERDVIVRTPCNVEIFDCFYSGRTDLPADLQSRARWHKICVGDPEINKHTGKEFMTLRHHEDARPRFITSAEDGYQGI